MGITGARVRAIAILSAVAAIVLGAGVAASAAPPYQSDADITSLAFTAQTVESGTSARLAGTWALPDNPSTPAGFSIDLPAQLQGRTDAFPLTDPAGATIGQCTVTAASLWCDIDDAYVAAHPLDLHGSFDFWVTVQTQVDQSTSTTYQVGGQAVTVTVTPPTTGQCTQNCAFEGRGNYKYGTYDDDANAIDWTVAVAAGPNGMAGGETVTVEDTPGPHQTLVTRIGDVAYPVVYSTKTVRALSDGTYWPADFEVLDPSTVTVVSPGKVSFVSEAGAFYDVHFATTVDDAGQGGTHTYSNSAAITITGQDDDVTTGTVVHQGGGATGSGTPGASPSPTPTPSTSATPTATPSPSATTGTPHPTLSPTVDAAYPEISPTPAAASLGTGLAVTGGTIAGWVAPIALLLVVLGAALVGARVRRS